MRIKMPMNVRVDFVIFLRSYVRFAIVKSSAYECTLCFSLFSWKFLTSKISGQWTVVVGLIDILHNAL
jgi:hypothetical protein